MSENGVDNDPGTIQADLAREVVSKIVAGCGREAKVTCEQTEDAIRIDVTGEDLAILIGRRAATLDAIQLLAFLISSNEVEGDWQRVVVDVDSYRARREVELFAAADRALGEVLSGSGQVELEPMTAQERRAVHNHLAEESGIETHSIGDDTDRRIVISSVANAS